MEPIYQQLGISLLLGLLVGLQREHAANGIAGMRTFPLIAVFGTLCASLAVGGNGAVAPLGGWIVAAGLLGVIAVLVLGHLIRVQQRDPHLGTTTEAALLVMYAVGAYLVVGPMMVAVAVGGTVAVLLQFKPELHGIAVKLGDADLRAIMQFVLISCIILPVLPNENFGLSQLFPQFPAVLDVFNPYFTWLMVVLIVGMSLGGYILYKFLGQNAGIFLGGVLGGIISSTAATASYARQARSDSATGTCAHSAAVVIMIASTISCVRVLISIAVVSPDFLLYAMLPVGIVAVLTFIPGLALWYWVRHRPAAMPDQKNPTQLKSALIFGLLYAVVLFALAAAKYYLGGKGLFAVAGLSGLTEMDAITLSTAKMSLQDADVMQKGWRMIVMAMMANMASKTAIAGILGGNRLFRLTLVLFAIPMFGGAVMLLLW
ncbi:MAG: MgtC/SapB family protein [Pirellulales bacterium]|nr:MgtC/SapB family protein [Pirellulales bacterium]